MSTYRKSHAERLAEYHATFDPKIVLDRLRGFSNAEVARLNGTTGSNVGNILRRYGVTERVDGSWYFHISTKRAGKLGLTEADLEATGATRSWPDIFRSAPVLNDHVFFRRYLLGLKPGTGLPM